MRNLIIKTTIAVFVLAAAAAPSVASAEDQAGDSSSQTYTHDVKTDGTSTGDSAFEKTRQHMIEMNKESQKTGKM